MSDACMFDTAKSATEIAAAMTTRCGGSDGLVAYAPMDATAAGAKTATVGTVSRACGGQAPVLEVEMCAEGSVTDVSQAEKAQLQAILAGQVGVASDHVTVAIAPDAAGGVL